MTVQRWETVKELLQQALHLEPAQRAAFLDEACPSDPSLRAEVESLLLADEAVRSSFLQSKTLVADRHRNGAISALEAGQVFEQRFQLVRKVGEGGMGQVWLAEQVSPVRRQVALKLIKAGMYDEAVVQRFRSERQSLAIMDHPAIAKVFDAGTTPQGQPYLVMEYVPGLPITDYCDQHKLSIKDRLRLFIHAMRGRATRAPESDHPSGSEALEYSGHRSRRQTQCRELSTLDSPRRPRRKSGSPTRLCLLNWDNSSVPPGT
jgi:hypothetical protein